MFWLFDDNNTQTYNFIQIFHNYEKTKINDDNIHNILYNFESTNIIDKNELDTLKSKIKPIQYIFDVIIKNNYIQYYNNVHVFTFEFEQEFVKDSDEDNNLKLPYFNWIYNVVDNKKLPLLSSNNYDFYYPNSIFDIYKINDDELFIINTINNLSKKFFLKKLN